ncbi:UNVERIFIED_CONTAM: Trafficking protein particle complex subunit 6B [Trichonephila clavipes]|uniref:Trafficking protein particle complex subunit 6B n=1 Tax=Trichonephila inaurata madagascariensis TaxID=2747483 RepID=A0A8X7C2Z3_9ARAC|nr:trafficking protein particle complex subunit 6b [Trichonephila inaurata madagascariensis]
MADEVLFDLLHLELICTYASSADECKEFDVSKLETIGFYTGYRLVERLTREWARFKDELDIMKFICKDFWSSVFKKEINNLRTNNQGVYVLHDNAFRFLTKVTNSNQFLSSTPKYLAFTCGLVRGALMNLGITSVVTADVSSPPSCKFQVVAQRM